MLQYLIVCPLVFLAGLVDSIAGGGGLIALPAYLIAGVPAHVALGTNKLSSAMGTTVSTARLAKHGFLKGKVLMAVCSSAAALMGSALGAHLALMVPESVIKHMMIVVLPVVAFYVLRNKDMGARDRTEDISRNKVFAISMAAAFFVGGYDGFYGPGTGTFLILILTGTAYCYIIISLSPVFWKSNLESVDPFCNNHKMKVASRPDHLPSFRPPFVRFFHKEIRGHTSIHRSLIRL